LKIKALQEKL